MNVDEKLKRLILVSGPGRSGTSLCMASLSAAGIEIAGGKAEKTEQNLEGLYEHSHIREINSKLQDIVFKGSIAPNPNSWGYVPGVTQCRNKIKKELEHIFCSNICIAIKDPRIANLLPVYISILNKMRVLPVYILCIRHPADVGDSMARQYLSDPSLGQHIWFVRTLWFLYHSGCRVFLMHYEDWFNRPKAVVDALCKYLKGSDLQIRTFNANLVIDKRLRRINEAGRIVHPGAAQLYSLLTDLRFDRFEIDDLRRRISKLYKCFMMAPPVFAQLYQPAQQSTDIEHRIHELERRLDELELHLGSSI